MHEKWLELIEKVDYAFQPIVNIHSGRLYALEALIRNYESKYFSSIDSVFDTAYNENVLYKLDIQLRKKAIKKFASYEFAKDIKLFYNLDNRITSMPDFIPGRTIDIIQDYNLDKSNICFELSEKHQAGAYAGIDILVLNMYKQQGHNMAIDDFGVGFSGLQMLYRAEPDFIKIDRFFITDINKSKKKKLFVSSIIEIAQAMGISIIAEGAETREEYEECKRLGCDMVQGYYVAKPTLDIEKIMYKYSHISHNTTEDRRADKKISNIETFLEYIPAVGDNANLDDVMECFKKNIGLTVIPILSRDLNPMGIIKELDLKQYVYSQYGYSILKNQTKGVIKSLIISCGSADVNDSFEKILKIYSANSENGGIIITKDKQYLGYLSAKVILDIINQKNLLDAKDQNPLSGLNGNTLISQYIASRVNSKESSIMVYFDFDNFKPFNDYYGFRKGDRVILLFAEILKKVQSLPKSLIGHIGGDDFFLGWEAKDESCECVYEKISAIVEKFAVDIESFYDEKDRQQGYILAKNRESVYQKFPLMTVSAAMISIPSHSRVSEETITEELSKLKKSAKSMENHISWSTFLQ